MRHAAAVRARRWPRIGLGADQQDADAYSDAADANLHAIAYSDAEQQPDADDRRGDGVSDADVHTDPDGNANRDAKSFPDAVSEPNSNSEHSDAAHRHGDADQSSDTDGSAYAFAKPIANTCYTNADACHANVNTDADGNADADGNPNRDAEPIANAIPDRDRRGGDSDTVAIANANARWRYVNPEAADATRDAAGCDGAPEHRRLAIGQAGRSDGPGDRDSPAGGWRLVRRVLPPRALGAPPGLTLTTGRGFNRQRCHLCVRPAPPSFFSLSSAC